MSQVTLSERPYTNSNLFSGHYLDERISYRDEWDCDEEALEALEELQTLYNEEQQLVSGYREDALVDNWIDKVLEVLGFGTNVETTLPDGTGYVDTLLFEDTEARRDAATVYLDTEDTTDLFQGGVGLLEAKQWGADFSQRFSEQRPYRNASHQIKHYLERTPENIQWGILTNGKKWRLYGTKDYETQTYYEADLPELLEHGSLEAFKYFYVFFRPEAFQGYGETTFLDTVWSESETVAQELGEDLQDNVFTALRVLGRGFVETNDLDIDPDDDEELDQLKEQSLVLLYRLMFVLYAESRGLIHPEGKKAITDYEENFSLDELRLEIHDEIGEVDNDFDTYSEYSTSMWSRLEDLFRLIDEGEEDLGIPPYNGGLFNREKHKFLSNHEVSNRYLAEVIYRISTTENDEGRYVLADYADLDTRHLGSVYEGLLEHQFRIAPEDYAAVAEDGGQVWKPATEVSVADAVETVDEGGLYVVNDEGERKATGAYYTPDYVVTYIVEETVGPLIEEIQKDLENQGFEPGTHEYLGAFYKRVKDLKILDPAMGSGHFLTRATEYLAQQVMEEVRELEGATAFDEQRVRRDVAKECIYGVDLNGMAVELAKLSMWLETLAADQPLAFLDHHLKAGNSLVGSDITEVLSSDTEDNGGQLTLQQALARVRQETLEHVMDQMQELLEIDNETLEDVRSMEEIYDAVRSDPFYQRLFDLTNVHTAERFDIEVPEGAYERMAQAIDDEAEWAAVQEEDWFQTAQATSTEEEFFHWELEYPEVFFDEDGEKREDAGFDAVVGNPPYVTFRDTPEKDRDYYRNEYQTFEMKGDVYVLFTEKATDILREGGYTAYIIQNKFMRAGYGSTLRKRISEEETLLSVIDLHDSPVFDVTAYPMILVRQRLDAKSDHHVQWKDVRVDTKSEIEAALDNVEFPREIRQDELGAGFWHSFAGTNSFDREIVELGELCNQIGKGAVSGDTSVYLVSDEEIQDHNLEEEFVIRVLRGSDVDRYDISSEDELSNLIYPYEISEDGTPEPVSEEKIPNILSYLGNHRESLEERKNYGERLIDQGYEWYELTYKAPGMLNEKIVFPDISPENRFALDREGEFACLDTIYYLVRNQNDFGYHSQFITAVLNSSLLNTIFGNISPQVRGGYRRYKTQYVENLPIPYIEFEHDSQNEPEIEALKNSVDEYLYAESTIPSLTDSEPIALHDILVYTADEIEQLIKKQKSLNLSLLDYFGSYNDGYTLADIGFAQPPAGAGDSILTDTAEDRENLRIGDVEIDRESPTSLEIRLTARYKPEDEEDYETDRWGYTETKPLPALNISELSKTEADLVEAFVPVAINEAGGFANFRETATKTNSLVDRLRKLTLPAIGEVQEGLENYLETKARAEELAEKIEKTDQLIDEIVYELYGLTEEEIEIVEETVDQ
ncbi:Eco57I restriction-modification methylase domain-containing protein [Natronococcus occultus]|uniref:site-specific DNA-methyltransferase (adenine-specific) n=1 Tax=Natronococcus occultus SP4 TaxID=694430 RepID=L0JYT4_9EURY|nr:N-6 DNA methylase [Natronococcus occultus]AGB37023.1 type I restriction-modification system methyltransferase subunit [Natronococcus occultus SP4]